ncbi:hypothetical protein BGZ93_006747 [Podila epicladia]|nr:hypothetical protein BGZ92_007914 [Podila epicladia]KAG0094810.1 hypothetical protein BGZ93_006747 [Podila epicladia]
MLTSLKFKDGELNEEDIVLAMQATLRLIKFDDCLHTFMAGICDSMLYHADWMEKLHLTFQNGLEESILQQQSVQEAAFLLHLSERGWSVAHTPWAGNCNLLDEDLRYEVFAIVCNLKNMCQLHVEDYEYVHKARMGSDRERIN